MTNEPRPLLELYKLLWEQIKDKEIEFIQFELIKMRDGGIITKKETNIISNNVANRFIIDEDCLDRKSFVQRMITELENEKQ